MATWSDSRFVTDDIVAASSVGVPLTITQDVVAFTTDPNDPILDPDISGTQGYRTAFVRAAPTKNELIHVDASASNYAPANLLMAAWEVDPLTGYLWVISEAAYVAYDWASSAQMSFAMRGGVTYLIGVAQMSDDAVNTSLSADFTRSLSRAASSALLRLGVGTAQPGTYKSVYDLGGPGTYTSEHPFDVLYPPVSTSLISVYDLIGRVGKQTEHPFDLGTIAVWYSAHPFDLLADAPTPTVGVQPIPTQTPGTPTSAPQVLVGTVATTAGSTAVVGTGTAFTTQLVAGQTVNIGGALYVVGTITDNTHLVLITAASGTLTGATISLVNPPAVVTLTGTVTTTIGQVTVTGSGTSFTTQLVVGQTVNIGGATGVVAAIGGPTTLTLVAPATRTASGQVITLINAPVFIPGIAIYTKSGIYVGSVTLWSSIDSRSIAIGESGSMQFSVPIKDHAGNSNPELDLIQLDRIVVVGNNLGTPPWGGSISSLDWGASGTLSVACEDLSALMSNIEVGDTTGSVNPKDVPNPSDPWAVAERAKIIVALNGERASAAVAQVIAQVNQWRARDGEVLWDLDATGSATFFGDENITGDALSTLSLLAERSFAEYCWGVRVLEGRMNPVLIWRDAFDGGVGAALHDGSGGNVSVNIMYRETSTPIINAIRLTGSVTRIESEIPDGAQALPVAEIIPVAEVWLYPGPYRRRTSLGQSAGIKLNISVPFSFPADTQKALADAEQAKLMAMFKKYLAAVHDQLGQPYHSEGFNANSGWSWAGPTENVPEMFEGEPYTAFGERHLTMADWTHHRFLAPGPSSVVMEKNDGSQRVRVTFDLLTGTPTVKRNSLKSVEDPTKVYAFELRYLKNWDPRRDGIGELRNVTTVSRGAVVKGERWRIVSWNQRDQNVTTQLQGDRGLLPGDTTVYVVSTIAFPEPPFTAVIGGDETVLVTGRFAGGFIVVRGQGGTQAILHEPNEEFAYIAPATDEPASTDPEQLPPVRVPWPEGEAYARRLLQKLSRPHRVLSLNVVNRAGEWSTIALGSSHSVNIQAAGRTGGIVLTGRVIAYAPDELSGTMEAVLEVDLP